MTGPQRYILGIDIGTGSVKSVAVDLSGRVLEANRQFYPTLNPQPGWQEQDPDTIFHGFINCIRETVGKMGEPPIAVSLSSAMHSMMVVNAHGEPVTKLLLWSDNRSASIADDLRKSPLGVSFYETGGAPIHAMTPVCKLAWWHKHENHLFERNNTFISIKEYIWWRLFGEFRIDYSLASATGLFDINDCAWNEAALTFAGVERDQLSKPAPVSYRNTNIHTRCADRMHLPNTTPFIIGSSDGCLANVGTHALARGTAAITIGTSGAVRIGSPKPIRDFSSMSFNYIFDEDTFICGGPVNNGGNVLDWACKTFFPGESSGEYDVVFQKIQKVPPGCDGLIFLPYLHGERSPVWDEMSTGQFFGIRSYHDSAYFVRAAIEGVCFALRQILLLLEKASEPIQKIHVSGGFLHSKQWMQLLADITGKTLLGFETADASAIGAAYLGLKTMDVVQHYDSLNHPPAFHIEADPGTRDIYEKNFKVFERLYPVLKDLMHEQ